MTTASLDRRTSITPLVAPPSPTLAPGSGSPQSVRVRRIARIVSPAALGMPASPNTPSVGPLNATTSTAASSSPLVHRAITIRSPRIQPVAPASPSTPASPVDDKTRLRAMQKQMEDLQAKMERIEKLLTDQFSPAPPPTPQYRCHENMLIRGANLATTFAAIGGALISVAALCITLGVIDVHSKGSKALLIVSLISLITGLSFAHIIRLVNMRRISSGLEPYPGCVNGAFDGRVGRDVLGLLAFIVVWVPLCALAFPQISQDPTVGLTVTPIPR